MTEANITVEDLVSGKPDQKVKLITFSGQLDESNVDEESKTIYALIDATPQGLSMIFNFKDLDYMNSKAIGYLTDWYTKLSEKKGKIVIAQAKDNILDILNVVGLTQLIPCVGTFEEAKIEIAK